MAKSASKLVESVHKMLTGLESNSDNVVKRGATPEFIKSGKSLLDRLETLQTEQDTLMATLKTQQDTARAAIKAKKAALAITRAQLRTWKSESTRAIKRAYRNEKEKWVDYGIKVKFAKAKKNKKSKK
jgi:hypothetical protein